MATTTWQWDGNTMATTWQWDGNIMATTTGNMMFIDFQ